MKFIKKRFSNDPKAWLKFVAVAVLGAGLGYAYYYFFGCKGTCPITNNSQLTTALGLILGLNFGFDFVTKNKEKKEN